MPQSPAHLVAQFHQAFNLISHNTPTLLDRADAEVRTGLLAEEAAEAQDAVAQAENLEPNQALANIAQELADVVYVAYGTALAYGIDLDAVLAEVHRANMSKLGADGQPILHQGKVVKGPNFQPADVRGVLFPAE